MKLPIIKTYTQKELEDKIWYIAQPYTKMPKNSMLKADKAMYLLLMRGLFPFSPIAHTAPFHNKTKKILGVTDKELSDKMQYEKWDLKIIERFLNHDGTPNGTYDSGMIMLLDTQAIDEFTKNMISYYELPYELKLSSLKNKRSWFSSGCYDEVMWAIKNHVLVANLDWMINSRTLLKII